MLKRLRRKLIAASMLSLLLVLTVVMGAVNIISYRNMVRQADTTLALLADNNGSFSNLQFQDDKGRPAEKPAEQPAEFLEDPGLGAEPRREMIDRQGREKRFLSPELPFMSRYFSVLFTGDGEVISTDTANIAAVDEASAIEMAELVRKQSRTCGFVGDYRYVCVEQGDGERVIFLDCQRERMTFRTFLGASCGISAAGLAAVFVLILIFSRRIIKPVSESYEKQRRFITDAGHELKTPVTIIDADAEVLEMEVGDDNEWLRDIRRQAERLGTLTADLIYLSRMEEERPPELLIEFPFSDVVAETAQSFAAPAKTQEKQFTIEVEPMLTLRGDERAIRQLVSILLDNALKYSPDGGEIALTAHRQGRSLLLAVTNTAEPMTGENLAHLFDRFYRVDSSRSAATGGYGIGLSVARAIVTAHKGKITASMTGDKLTIAAVLP